MMEKMNPVVTALRDDIRRRQQGVQHIASLEEQHLRGLARSTRNAHGLPAPHRYGNLPDARL